MIPANYQLDDSGLWLPRYGLVGPDRRRPSSRRFMPGYPCCCKKEEVCDCDLCAGTPPWNMLVNFNGLSGANCTTGMTLHGNYLLECKGKGTGNTCKWSYTLPSPICKVSDFVLYFSSTGLFGIEPPASLILTIESQQLGSPLVAWIFMDDYSYIDCAAIENWQPTRRVVWPAASQALLQMPDCFCSLTYNIFLSAA